MITTFTWSLVKFSTFLINILLYSMFAGEHGNLTKKVLSNNHSFPLLTFHIVLFINFIGNPVFWYKAKVSKRWIPVKIYKMKKYVILKEEKKKWLYQTAYLMNEKIFQLGSHTVLRTRNLVKVFMWKVESFTNDQSWYMLM